MGTGRCGCLAAEQAEEGGAWQYYIIAPMFCFAKPHGSQSTALKPVCVCSLCMRASVHVWCMVTPPASMADLQINVRDLAGWIQAGRPHRCSSSSSNPGADMSHSRRSAVFITTACAPKHIKAERGIALKTCSTPHPSKALC